MVAKHPPVLQPCDGVLDACSSATVATPRTVSDDPVAAEDRRDQFGHTAIASVSQHASMPSTQSLDDRGAVMHRIVAVAGTASTDRDDAQITTADEDLRVARPPVVLRL